VSKNPCPIKKQGFFGGSPLLEIGKNGLEKPLLPLKTKAI
jgi:hypothetical protein